VAPNAQFTLLATPLVDATGRAGVALWNGIGNGRESCLILLVLWSRRGRVWTGAGRVIVGRLIGFFYSEVHRLTAGRRRRPPVYNETEEAVWVYCRRRGS